LETDVRELLPELKLPVLVLHREGDQMVLPYFGRFLADHIPGSRFVVLPGSCHPPHLGANVEVDALIDAIAGFVGTTLERS
jgi:pimeloyl-ACP methyl ester carboxylesterase